MQSPKASTGIVEEPKTHRSWEDELAQVDKILGND